MATIIISTSNSPYEQWVGGACDVAVVACHPEMGPVATLQAEAHSGDIGHRWGTLRAWVCCVVAR